MRIFLLAALVALAMMAIALPAAAWFDGEARVDLSRCRAESARLGFKNRGACVKHIAHGGTLATTPTFEQICDTSQGQFAASGVVNTTPVAPICVWSLTPAQATLSALIESCVAQGTSAVVFFAGTSSLGCRT
jgi:hypothetical protein